MYGRYQLYCLVGHWFLHVHLDNSGYTLLDLSHWSSSTYPSCRRLSRSTMNNKHLVISKDAHWILLFQFVVHSTTLLITIGQNCLFFLRFSVSPHSKIHKHCVILHLESHQMNHRNSYILVQSVMHFPHQFYSMSLEELNKKHHNMKI